MNQTKSRTVRKSDKKPLALANWWPGRGPLPKHLHEPKYELPAPITKDVEIIQSAIVSIEKAAIKAIVTGDEKTRAGQQARPKPKSKMRSFKLKRSRPRYYDDFMLNHHVESIASIPFETAQRLIIGGAKKALHGIALEIEPQPITIRLNYPLSRAVEVTIKPYERNGRKWMNLGYILWIIAREYKRIYKQHKHYGIWGHMLDDLWFERLTIKNGRGELFIGS